MSYEKDQSQNDESVSGFCLYSNAPGEIAGIAMIALVLIALVGAMSFVGFYLLYLAKFNDRELLDIQRRQGVFFGLVIAVGVTVAMYLGSYCTTIIWNLFDSNRATSPLLPCSILKEAGYNFSKDHICVHPNQFNPRSEGFDDVDSLFKRNYVFPFFLEMCVAMIVLPSVTALGMKLGVSIRSILSLRASALSIVFAIGNPSASGSSCSAQEFCRKLLSLFRELPELLNKKVAGVIEPWLHLGEIIGSSNQFKVAQLAPATMFVWAIVRRFGPISSSPE